MKTSTWQLWHQPSAFICIPVSVLIWLLQHNTFPAQPVLPWFSWASNHGNGKQGATALIDFKMEPMIIPFLPKEGILCQGLLLESERRRFNGFNTVRFKDESPCFGVRAARQRVPVVLFGDISLRVGTESHLTVFLWAAPLKKNLQPLQRVCMFVLFHIYIQLTNVEQRAEGKHPPRAEGRTESFHYKRSEATFFP